MTWALLAEMVARNRPAAAVDQRACGDVEPALIQREIAGSGDPVVRIEINAADPHLSPPPGLSSGRHSRQLCDLPGQPLLDHAPPDRVPVPLAAQLGRDIVDDIAASPVADGLLDIGQVCVTHFGTTIYSISPNIISCTSSSWRMLALPSSSIINRYVLT